MIYKNADGSSKSVNFWGLVTKKPYDICDSLYENAQPRASDQNYKSYTRLKGVSRATEWYVHHLTSIRLRRGVFR